MHFCNFMTEFTNYCTFVTWVFKDDGTYIANIAFFDVRNVLSNLDCFGVQHANFAACKTAFDGAQNAADSVFIA